MDSLFSDCLSLLIIPDISKFNNYNEKDLIEKPNYNLIDKILNFTFDFYISVSKPESHDILNDNEFKKKMEYEMNKFL